MKLVLLEARQFEQRFLDSSPELVDVLIRVRVQQSRLDGLVQLVEEVVLSELDEYFYILQQLKKAHSPTFQQSVGNLLELLVRVIDEVE